MSRDTATKGIIKRPELDRELNKIRELGYVENFTEHLISYAVPLFKYDGEVVAGINICIPKARASMKMIYEEYLPSLIDKGKRISSELGYIDEPSHWTGARRMHGQSREPHEIQDG
jgi:DNA-binding IclR family transcriptional regulator